MQGTEHCGWLKAKDLKGGHRRLFFYLRGGRLAWYRSAEDWTEFEKGSLLLEQCQVKRELSEAKSFTIYNPSNAAVTYAFKGYAKSVIGLLCCL